MNKGFGKLSLVISDNFFRDTFWRLWKLAYLCGVKSSASAVMPGLIKRESGVNPEQFPLL